MSLSEDIKNKHRKIQEERGIGVTHYIENEFMGPDLVRVFIPRMTYYNEWVWGRCYKIEVSYRGFFSDGLHTFYFKTTDEIPDNLYAYPYSHRKSDKFKMPEDLNKKKEGVLE